MPFMRDGKCVYKKNKDGSRGKKEGCSDSVEKAKDYLKALYANVDDATKKENKTMKIKKSELLALIKEEIMSEMDEPRNDEDTMQETKLQEGVGMPEIMAFVNAVIKFASDPVTAPLVAAVVAGTPLMLAFEQYSEMKKKKEGGK
jgi:urease gamma subunit|tara:strand:+ start:197 stop:631 length:435 start_codon:yes stop_codon:yes gene_type:complete